MNRLTIVGLPAAVLAGDASVLVANELLEQLGSQIVVAAFDRLRLANPGAQKQLDAALAKARLAGPSQASQSFPLPREDEAPPAVVHLLPIRGNARDIFARASFFVVVTPIDTKSVPTAEMIAGLFDLSPAEARVARALASGADVGETADRHGLGRETVRSHVKAIFGKTGLSRQADLLALLARIPVITR